MYWRVISAIGISRISRFCRRDEVEQHVERALEGLEKHLERLRRDVQIARHFRDGLALDDRERHLALRRRRHGRRRGGRCIRHELQFRFHR